MLEIPFYPTHGPFCAESVFKSAVNYFLEERIGFRDAKIALGRENGKYLYPVNVVNALIDQGLNIFYFSSFDFEKFLNMSTLQKEQEFKNAYGKFADTIISKTNFNNLDYNLGRIVQQGYQKRELSFDEVQEFFNSGKTVLCLLNNDIFNGKENQYHGHYALITDIGADFVNYHEVGPFDSEPNRQVSKKRFVDSWNQTCFFDEDTIIINGLIRKL